MWSLSESLFFYDKRDSLNDHLHLPESRHESQKTSNKQTLKIVVTCLWMLQMAIKVSQLPSPQTPGFSSKPGRCACSYWNFKIGFEVPFGGVCGNFEWSLNDWSQVEDYLHKATQRQVSGAAHQWFIPGTIWGHFTHNIMVMQKPTFFYHSFHHELHPSIHFSMHLLKVNAKQAQTV